MDQLPENLDQMTPQEFLSWLHALPEDSPLLSSRPERLAFFIMEQEMLSQRPTPSSPTSKTTAE